MSKSISLKSLTTAAAVAATLAFGAAAHAQVTSTTPPIQKNQDSAQPAPESKTGATKGTATGSSSTMGSSSSTGSSTNKAMNSTDTTKKGTNSGASKLDDSSKPATKGDGKS